MEKSDAAWTTFSTSLGVCGVSWTARGIDSFLSSGGFGNDYRDAPEKDHRKHEGIRLLRLLG